MKNISIGLPFMLFLIGTSIFRLDAQTIPGLEKWDAELINQANTAKDESYLSGEEKAVILLNNLARTDGAKFSQTFLEPWITEKGSSKYTRSLQKDLKEVKNLPMLMPSELLWKLAKAHAEKSGKMGTTGHQNFDKRSDEAMKIHNMFGENCAYGYETALDNVLGLLIDEGVPGVGHRENMLNPDFNSIGVSMHEHKKYRFNLVMNFGRKNN